MDDIASHRHCRWECKGHVAWIPKCRWVVLHGQLRQPGVRCCMSWRG